MDANRGNKTDLPCTTAGAEFRKTPTIYCQTHGVMFQDTAMSAQNVKPIPECRSFHSTFFANCLSFYVAEKRGVSHSKGKNTDGVREDGIEESVWT
jgi:hypothetical protein